MVVQKQLDPCNHVVYIHRKGSPHGEPFYVGIGTPGRPYEFRKGRRGKHWRRVYEKYGVHVEVYAKDLCRKDAYKLEVELIAKYKRIADGGTLVNHTLGGDGPGLGNKNATGKRSDEARQSFRHHQAKPVRCVETGMIYLNSHMAAVAIGTPEGGSHIRAVCRGERNTAYGYSWEWVRIESDYTTHPLRDTA